MKHIGTTITDLEALVDKHRGCYGSGEPTADDPASVPEPDYRDAPTLEQRAASFLEFNAWLNEIDDNLIQRSAQRLKDMAEGDYPAILVEREVEHFLKLVSVNGKVVQA